MLLLLFQMKMDAVLKRLATVELETGQFIARDWMRTWTTLTNYEERGRDCLTLCITQSFICSSGRGVSSAIQKSPPLDTSPPSVWCLPLWWQERDGGHLSLPSHKHRLPVTYPGLAPSATAADSYWLQTRPLTRSTSFIFRSQTC